MVTEVLGDGNILKEIHGPYNTGMPFSCIRCGHQSFLALRKEMQNGLGCQVPALLPDSSNPAYLRITDTASTGALSVRANSLQ